MNGFLKEPKKLSSYPTLSESFPSRVQSIVTTILKQLKETEKQPRFDNLKWSGQTERTLAPVFSVLKSQPEPISGDTSDCVSSAQSRDCYQQIQWHSIMAELNAYYRFY